MSRFHLSSVAAAVAAVLASSQLAYAQDQAAAPEAAAEPAAIEEIVVTAQKRAESIQEVPLSIMAVGSDMLEKTGVNSAADLTRLVPNLRINRLQQASGMTIRIRGVGAPGNSSIDPSVAPFIDSAYIARPGVMLSSFLDVESVEVLRGPQGTLFGRNATTGALQVHTRAPSFSGVEGDATFEVGNYGAYKLAGAVNVPLSDTFAMRFAGLSDGHDGYWTNRLNGKTVGDRESQAGRISARWQITDDLEWTIRGDYAQVGGDGAAPLEVDTRTATAAQLAAFTTRLGGNPPDLGDPADHKVKQQIVGNLDDTQWGMTSDLDWNLGSDYRIRWIASYRDWENEQLDGDVLFTPLSITNRHGSFDSNSQSQEVQFISPEGALLGGRLDFVAGLYYFQEDYKIGENLDLGSQYCSVAAPAAAVACNAALPKTGATQLDFNQDAESYAAYTELKFALTDTLDLTLGGRYTSDDKSAHFVQLVPNAFAAPRPPAYAGGLRLAEDTALDFSDDQFTYRVVLSWQLADDAMLFANYSTGYKSGGINSAGGTGYKVAPSLAPIPLGEKRLFASETVQNIELGAKSSWFSNTLQLNATLFQMEIDDFQDRSFDGTSFLIKNAGSLRQRGIEIEGQAIPVDPIRLNFALAYLDSEFTDYQNASGLPGCTGLAGSCPLVQDLTGAPAPYSPEWQGNLGAEYRGDFSNGLGWSLRADANYFGEHYAGGVTDMNPQTIQEAYTLLGARLTLHGRDDVWSVSVYGENLTDEVYNVNFTYQPLDNALGVRVPATGATLVRNGLSDPRTWGVALRFRF